MQHIDIDLKPSRIVNGCILVLSLSSLLIVGTLSIFWVLKVVFVSLLLFGVQDLLWRINGHRVDSIQGLRLIRREECQLRLRDETVSALICGDSTVTNQICVLRFKELGKRKIYSCVIMSDSVPPTDYHALLIWLRTL